MTEALTPYAGTSGWSGSDTSRERVERADKDGTTAQRQQATLGLVDACGIFGVTVRELREITGWHHGVASSCLSVLHKEGRLARLTERRDRCAVYVLPSDVRNRETSPHRSNKPVPEHRPARGDDVEQWLLGRQVRMPRYGAMWAAMENAINDYREHADAGVPLSEEVRR